MNTKKLKQARLNVNLTQHEVAKKIGISTKTYNRKELGMADFSLHEVTSLIELLYLSFKEVNEIFFENKIT
ncbi:helix-turn-helix transcriptional regulator [Zhenhengia sp.]|uniref:helix-turn-helix transcriptional regulator n=1 Tax=Zhenhengia sp. TaxID=2944208 RepID=UPI0030792DB8|nr:helix-turn-helix transcriptional regulator [Clostridiales bacterium]